MTFSQPKSPLTSARMFDTTTSEALAYWLDNDAAAMDGQPGRNNHVAATRAAVERLHAAWLTLGFIDQTIYANEDNGNLVKWDNAEVLEMLRTIRSTLLEGPAPESADPSPEEVERRGVFEEMREIDNQIEAGSTGTGNQGEQEQER